MLFVWSGPAPHLRGIGMVRVGPRLVFSPSPPIFSIRDYRLPTTDSGSRRCAGIIYHVPTGTISKHRSTQGIRIQSPSCTHSLTLLLRSSDILSPPVPILVLVTNATHPRGQPSSVRGRQAQRVLLTARPCAVGAGKNVYGSGVLVAALRE